MKRVAFHVVIALLLVSSAALPAAAQSNRELSARLQRAEREIETLSRALFRGEQPPPNFGSGSASGGGSSADVEIRLQQMEQEIRTLRGQLEEREFEIRELRGEYERLTSDLELRVNDLERGKTTASPSRNITAQPTPATNTPPPTTNQGYRWDSNNTQTLGTYTQSTDSGTVSGGADLAMASYDNAFSLVKAKQYDAAEREFQAFLNAHPDHPLAGNAKYWLGETFYVRGEFDQAARLFAEGYQQFPQGSKAADNLLKLALSLGAMGKQEDACIALGQIQKEGFAGAGPVLRRAETESKRLGC